MPVVAATWVHATAEVAAEAVCAIAYHLPGVDQTRCHGRMAEPWWCGGGSFVAN